MFIQIILLLQIKIKLAIDEKKPLWRYAKILERTGKGLGGNVRIRCRLCNHVWNGRYSRVKAHLLKITGLGVKFCRVVTVHVLEQLKAEVAAASAVADRTMPRDIPLPVEGNEKRKRRGVSAIESSFNLDVRRQLDELIARMFYTGGLLFNLARNPYFRKAFIIVSDGWSDTEYIAEKMLQEIEDVMIKNFIMNHSMRFEKWSCAISLVRGYVNLFPCI
ncbi:hypothetical protein ACJX0J_032589 [Zea mays]